MNAFQKALALTAGLLLSALACGQPEDNRQAPQSAGDTSLLNASAVDAEPISAEALAQAVVQARGQAREAADPSKDPRRFVEEFQFRLRPKLEKMTGQELPPLPIDPRPVAMPMYANYAAMIASNQGTDTYRGDKKKGAERFETVALPLPNDHLCTAVVIARNAIATARHCAEKKPERIRLGPTVDSETEIEIESQGFVFLKTPGGDPLDMAILVRKDPIQELKDADLPVFASQAMIDNAKTLLVVGYGGAKANSSESGTKRLGRIPMLSPDCSKPGIATAYQCRPGLEIVAGNLPMFGRLFCPPSNAANPVQGACKGDSGGPVYVEGEDNKLYLAALVRSILPDQCGCADATNLYVRFDKQLDTIKKIKDIDFHPEAFSKIAIP